MCVPGCFIRADTGTSRIYIYTHVHPLDNPHIYTHHHHQHRDSKTCTGRLLGSTRSRITTWRRGTLRSVFVCLMSSAVLSLFNEIDIITPYIFAFDDIYTTHAHTHTYPGPRPCDAALWAHVRPLPRRRPWGLSRGAAERLVCVHMCSHARLIPSLPSQINLTLDLYAKTGASTPPPSRAPSSAQHPRRSTRTSTCSRPRRRFTRRSE
jgi:hypothetical protein